MIKGAWSSPGARAIGDFALRVLITCWAGYLVLTGDGWGWQRLLALAVLVIYLGLLAASVQAFRRRSHDPLRRYRGGEHEVWLEDPGPTGLQVVKVVRGFTNLGLLEARTMLDQAPVAVAAGLTAEGAEHVGGALEAAGALTSVRGPQPPALRD